MNSSGVKTVVAISGSLRKSSLNTALLRATMEIAPETLDIRLLSLEGVPLYNEELEYQAGIPDVDTPEAPAAVEELRSAVRSADAVILSTPEYNRGPSGVMKNAIDWLSRPAFDQRALRGKDCLVLVATPGNNGYAAWTHLGQTVRHLGNHVVEAEVIARRASKCLTLDEAGEPRFQDDATKGLVLNGLAALEASIDAKVGEAAGNANLAYLNSLVRPKFDESARKLGAGA